MLPEERDGETIHAERDAAGVCDRAALVAQAPGRSKMVLMVIEAHAGGRLLGRMHGDQQLEFQRLLELADRHYLAGAAEERVVCGSDPVRQPQLVRQALGLPGPTLPETGHLPGRTDIDVFAHAERLQAIEMPGRLAPEAIAGYIEPQPAARDRAAARRQRIHRIAGGRGEH